MPTARLSRDLAQQAIAALNKCGGNKLAAADLLGIPEGTLHGRLRAARTHYGLMPAEPPPVQPVPDLTTPSPLPGTPARDLKAEVSAFLRRGNDATISAIAESLQVSPGTVYDAVAALERGGINVFRHGPLGDTISLERTPLPVSAADELHVYPSDADGRYRFGVVSDNHLGSKYARLDVLNELYDWFAAEGITRVYNAGNWIDGEARFNRMDLLVHGMSAQVEYMIEKYPRRPKMTTFYVAGDDHEGWYCFEPGTEILTKERGWVDFAKLSGSEHVATKTAEGEWQWQVPTKVVERTHDGELIRFKHRSVDLAVTPDHRFEVEYKTSMHAESVRRVVTAQQIFDEFKPRCFGIPRTTDEWHGHGFMTINIPRQPSRYAQHPRIWHPGQLPAGDLAVLCAWYAAEGWVDRGCVHIGQCAGVNEENRALIHALIAGLGGRPLLYDEEIAVSSADLAVWLTENCGSGWAEKRLPDWALGLPKETLARVFDALLRGDGHGRGEGKGWKFYSGSAALLAQAAELAQKLGYTVSYAPGKGCVNMHVGEVHKTAFLFERPTMERYAGPVYCVSVPNERIFVRRNGKTLWSMNCQRELVDIGRMVEIEAREAGRDDLRYLGYMEAWITLRRADGAEAKMWVVHPGGGAAYATSYAPQKMIESLQGGEKPAVAIVGHFHKMELLNYRSVWIYQAGTTMDQSPFMRKRRLDAHVGGGIIELRQDAQGAITDCIPHMRRYFDRGYYQHQYDPARPVVRG